MQGKLIIIEAGDGCGKATQTKALSERLRREGKAVHQIAFPDYQSDSSALIRMYLGGQFGARPGDVNAYAASAFYAVDRYASFKTTWQAWYERGDVIIADRYTTSNMVHQAVKIEETAEREAFLDWLWDFEFVKMGLPAPDAVFFLEMPPACSARLISARAAACGAAKDLHERDQAYLARCHDLYGALAKKYGWQTVRCTADGQLKSVETIHEEIYAHARTFL